MGEIHCSCSYGSKSSGASAFRSEATRRRFLPPLTPEEIDTLRHHFRVRVAYPELLLMRLAGVYLFRGHLQRPLGRLDAMLFHIEPLRKYGYRQYVYLE